jgi:virginiamycin B lyase
MRNALITLGLVFMLTDCSQVSSTVSPPINLNQSGHAIPAGAPGTPYIVQRGSHWATFLIYQDCCEPGLVVGPDKNIWQANYNDEAYRIAMTGSVKAFPYSPGSGASVNLTVGADGKFYWGWRGTPDNSIGVGTVRSSKIDVTLVSIPSGDAAFEGMTLGPDGNVWFLEGSHVGKITTGGILTEYTYPTDVYTAVGITGGSDGNVWFTYLDTSFAGHVAKVSTTGTITAYPISCQPYGITSAADGNLWAACASSIVRVTTAGAATTYPATGLAISSYYDGIARGPDGNPWFAGSSAGCPIVGEINTATHHITTHKTPLTCQPGFTQGNSLVAGPDGNIWMTEQDVSSNVYAAVYILNLLTVTPKSLTFTATGQTQSITATETGNPTLTATSSNPAVATVAPGPTNTFIVTSVAAGTCKVIVADSIGNSFNVKVTVQ